jgi:hypothetical protein
MGKIYSCLCHNKNRLFSLAERISQVKQYLKLVFLEIPEEHLDDLLNSIQNLISIAYKLRSLCNDNNFNIQEYNRDQEALFEQTDLSEFFSQRVKDILQNMVELKLESNKMMIVVSDIKNSLVYKGRHQKIQEYKKRVSTEVIRVHKTPWNAILVTFSGSLISLISSEFYLSKNHDFKRAIRALSAFFFVCAGAILFRHQPTLKQEVQEKLSMVDSIGYFFEELSNLMDNLAEANRVVESIDRSFMIPNQNRERQWNSFMSDWNYLYRIIQF